MVDVRPSMGMARLCLVVLGAMMPLCWSFQCKTYTKNPDAPHLPNIIGNSYQAHIELNIVNKNKTMSIEEYLDFEGNRAARIIYSDNSVTKNIFSFSTDEIFIEKGSSCQVVNMSSPEGQRLLLGGGGATTAKDGEDARHTFGAAQTFRYAADNSDFYVGNDTVRGIPAYKWSSCQDIIPGVAMQVTYYFNVPEWDMQVKGQSLPLRIEVEGDWGGSRYFYHIYEFINYEPTILVEPQMFETSGDVVCVGRKSTKTLPGFSKQFSYMAENIDPLLSDVKYYRVWYDGVAKMVRIDNPNTEIHDYNTGVRYVRDQILRNCSVHPLIKSSSDGKINPDKTIEMSDPSRFFSFSQNYVYIGQRRTRGLLCDVFSAYITDYTVDGVTANATFHYYFLAEDWNDQPLQQGIEEPKSYPVRLEIEVPTIEGLNKFFNFFDFAETQYNFDVFDVSDCIDDGNKVNFRLIFPATYNAVNLEQWKLNVFYKLANVMSLSPSRIGNLKIGHDPNNVFVTATILGTSPSAEFELVSQIKTERIFHTVYYKIPLSKQCAELCVKSKDFLCQGYQYCPDDNYSCSLTNNHTIGDRDIVIQGPRCDFFTRTVPKFKTKEPTLDEAYSALVSSVKNKDFHLDIERPNSFVDYVVAIGVQQISGYRKNDIPMPSITSQFSYRCETVLPQSKVVYDFYVWYDADLKFLRHDSRATDEISTIQDFNIGVSYKINKVTGRCKIAPLSLRDHFIDKAASTTEKDGFKQIKMKTPLGMFYLDDSYTYIGERTVRGILCDAFQTRTSNFTSGTEDVVTTVFFQSESWSYLTADSLDTTTSQPVQMLFEHKTGIEPMISNFYDYNDEHHTFNYYDMSACYEPDQKRSFQIIFKDQPYDPYLEGIEPTFLNTAILRLGEVTRVSPLRFQHVDVSHDDSNVYLTATALGDVPDEYLFHRGTNVSIDPNTQTLSAASYQDCAAACQKYSQTRPCNGFAFCPDANAPKCALLTTQDEMKSTGRSDPAGPCQHFMRTERSGFPVMDVDTLYKEITDAVYDNKFTIIVTPFQGNTKTYTATDIRDDILRPTDPDSTGGSALQKFKKHVDFALAKTSVKETHSLVSITDCALTCFMTTTLHCQSFDYSFIDGTCRFSDLHEDQMVTPLVSTKHVNTYTRSYLNDFSKHQFSMFSDNPDKVVTKIASSDLCAKICEENEMHCEAFEYCPDESTCNLRKTHNLPPQRSHPGKTPTCDHYSREYLYDYTKRSNHIIVGHDDLVIQVISDAECARHCSKGLVKHCASFELCQLSEGSTACKLSLADPTLQQDLPAKDDRQCNLYIRANPSPAVTSKNCTHDGYTPPQPTTTNPPSQDQSTTTPPPPPPAKNCTKVVKSIQYKSIKDPDTGARVGIAFGTLFLGILVGVVGMFLFSKWRLQKPSEPTDSHRLSDY